METLLEQPKVKRKYTRAPGYRPKMSTKPPAIKTEVIARRTQGETKSSISKALGITRNTVSSIIQESTIDQQIESGRLSVAGLIPESLRVVEVRLQKNSESAAFKVLEGIGVLRSGKDVNINIAATSSNSWYQRRIAPEQGNALDSSGSERILDAVHTVEALDEHKPSNE